MRLKQLLEDSARDVEYRHYLEIPPTLDELQQLFIALELDHPAQMMRGDDHAALSHNQCFYAIVENPNLLQRPIYIDNRHAVIARPPELAF